MARPDGRIEKGQRLSTAISARAWNRAQEAADRVLGAGTGVEANGVIPLRLPGVRVPLAGKGFYGQVATFGSNALDRSVFLPQLNAPYSTTSFSSFTTEEKNIVQATLPSFKFAPHPDGNSRFAICCTNDDNLWTISGFAITRIKVYNYRHRFAYLDSDDPGVLTSAFWGPATIVGFAASSGTEFRDASIPSTPLTWPNSETRWAMVMF
jgi:hypothetical protein